MLNLSRRPRGQPNRQRAGHMAAPIGGDNTISAGVDMPKEDSIYCYNMIGAEYGLRSRLGWREWCTNLDGQVRTLIPYTGSLKDGSANRLFACTQTGIWDVSSSSAAPSKIVTFGVQSADSGWGISTVFVTTAGHFLAYTDEENGYYVYSEANGTWIKVVQAASTVWQPTTAYVAGDYVQNYGVTYLCTAPGTSVASAWAATTGYVIGNIVSKSGLTYTCTKAGTSGTIGPSGTANEIIDGTVTWQWTQLGPSGAGTGITDGGVTWDYKPSMSGVDPAKLAFVVAWKNRLWFVEKDTAHGWYLGLTALYGNATQFNFGARFKAGGDLRGLWSWTFDGGSGMDDALVAVSGGGDVVIYRGTDPANAATFALSGVWFVGAVPVGRRIATDFGGDILLMSSIGIMPLSKLVIGNVVYDRSQYQTFKISNLFNQMQAATANLRGWAMRMHPIDSCLMVLVPTAVNQASQQLVMSLTTRGWSRYRDIPIGLCAEPWGGTLYFGTEDGRICANDGYVDGVLLSNANAFSAIEWSFLTSFQNLGDPHWKRLEIIRPRVLSQGGNVSFQATARYDWNMTEPSPPTLTLASGGSLWDSALWDVALWGGAYNTQSVVNGGAGIGSAVAIAIRGSSGARTTITGIDVTFTTGGVL